MGMRLVPVTSLGTVPTAALSRVTEAVDGLLTLADVLAWARSQAPPLAVAEIVTQDEYTHDVVLPFDGGHFLVFDAT
jgi:hypothetical protein